MLCAQVGHALWYFQLRDPTPGDATFFIRYSIQVIVQYLTAIGSELFGRHTRGGIVVMSFYFFLTYLLAVFF